MPRFWCGWKFPSPSGRAPQLGPGPPPLSPLLRAPHRGSALGPPSPVASLILTPSASAPARPEAEPQHGPDCAHLTAGETTCVRAGVTFTLTVSSPEPGHHPGLTLNPTAMGAVGESQGGHRGCLVTEAKTREEVQASRPVMDKDQKTQGPSQANETRLGVCEPFFLLNEKIKQNFITKQLQNIIILKEWPKYYSEQKS